MRFAKFMLPVWVASGLVAVSAATAADPSLPSRIDPNLYSQLAQNDAPVAAAPVLPAVPQEDAYQLRALPPQEAAQEASAEEGPNRYLEIEPLTSRGINTYGWIAAGIGANNWGSPFNGPITFNDRNWQGQMNQLYLVNERTLDMDNGRWLGGRVDLLYGTDYIYTTARGLDGNLLYQTNPAGVGGTPSWASSKDYGLAMPQLYAETGIGNHAIKFGHFYTIIGYEVVPAIGNFFYTHAYTMQYGEPFTHTGILDVWTANDQLTVYGGITNGWDNFSDPINYFGIANPGYAGANSNAAFLGGATFKSSDEAQALTTTVSSGNEIGSFSKFGEGIIGNRSIVSTVYINEVSDKLTYVFQNDLGWQFNANPVSQNIGQQNGTAQWYGINQYMFYTLSDSLVAGMRLEWFRDNNGYRVINPIRNAIWGGPFGTGYAGNFWQATWGLNWKPNRNIIVRPELRYDWYSPDNMKGPLPFGRINGAPGSGDQYGQFYGGCDAIWQF
ncbi:MAG: outer membrane beta-barrel protein [Planctomycetota bacterium]